MGTAQVDVSRPRIDHHAVDAAKVVEMIVRGVAVFYALVIALISFGYSILAYPQADNLERTAALRIFTRVQRITSDYNGIDGRWASKWIEYTLYKGGHVIERYPAMLMSVLVIGLIGCCVRDLCCQRAANFRQACVGRRHHRLFVLVAERAARRSVLLVSRHR